MKQVITSNFLETIEYGYKIGSLLEAGDCLLLAGDLGAGNDFDLEEYFSKDGVVVCEWPNNVSEIIPDEYLLIEIFRREEDSRLIKLTPYGKRYEKLVGDLDD